MSINNLAKRTYQPIGWKKDNKPIPEDHLTDIVECALNMPCAMLTATEHCNYKPYELWIPHRESELENALGCASVWASDQCQDHTFNNVSTALVYILKEPEHVADKVLSKTDYEFDANQSHLGTDKVMDLRIAKDWDSTQKLLKTKLTEELVRKKSMTYSDSPFFISPFAMWNAEHLVGLNLTVGLAMGAVSLRCRELGYYCQNYTAYRQTLTWHSKFENKFHSSGKWFPYMIQLLGTHPEAVKISEAREFRKAQSNSENIFDPNDIHVDNMADTDNGGLERLEGQDYRNKYIENFPREIPDYQIKFFMENYGRYSSDPKKLFKLAYSGRVKEWEYFFNEWMANDTKK
tara:strand:+ start:1540 stop:2583 length:1044 start_codon:yes stop_codon:yes gene_type:complete